MKKINVLIKKLHNFPKDFELPKYGSKFASGFDIKSTIKVDIPSRASTIIPTGFAIEIPVGYELQIRPRSGKSLKTSLRIPNSPATIDSDYRGEVGVIVSNESIKKNLIIEKGDKIAQGVICPVYQASWEEIDELDDTERGSDGFGSTGT